MKKRFLSLLLTLAMIVSMMPQMAVPAHAETYPQKYALVLETDGEDRGVIVGNLDGFPQTITGNQILDTIGLQTGEVCSRITKKGGSNTTLSGTNITVTGLGESTFEIWVKRTSGGMGERNLDYVFKVIAIKEITAEVTRYNGPYDDQEHGITVDVKVPSSGYTVKYGTREGVYNLDSSPKYKGPCFTKVCYQITADGYRTETGYAYVSISSIPVSGISLSDPPELIVAGTTAPLSATISPDNATFKTVTWSSSNPSVATVDENGVVTGVAPGTATITATATNGNTYAGDDKTATCVVTVDTGEGSISYEQDTVDKTYGDEPFTNPLTHKGDGALSFESDNTDVATVDNDGQVTIKGAGSATITTTVEDSEIYTYETKTASYTLNVAKADPSVTAPTPKSGLSYDGEEKELVELGDSDDGIVYYALGSETEAPAVFNLLTSPKGTDAGKYYVWYKVIGDQNHKDSTPDKVEANIAQKPAPTLTDDQKPTPKVGMTYTDEPQPLVSAPEELPTGYTVEYSLDGEDWSTDIPERTFAGDYTVKVRYNGGKNYTTFDGDDINVSIGKQAAPEPATLKDAQKPTANDLTYTREAQALVTKPEMETPEGAKNYQYTVKYALGDSDEYSEDIPKATDAGDYTVKVRYDGGNNYESFDGEPITVTIKPYTLTKDNITLEDLQYTGEAQDAEIAVKHGETTLAEGSEYTVSGALSGIDVNKYRVTVEGSGNYDGTVHCIWNIDRAPVTVTVNDTAKQYGDEDPEYTITAKDGKGQEIESSLIEWTASREEGETLGEYAVTPAGEEVQGNYNVTYVPGKLTITRRQAVVKADNKSKRYGEKDPEFTFTTTGFIGDDIMQYYGIRRTEDGEEIGEYTIKPWGPEEQGNYIVSFETGKLTISKRPLDTSFVKLDHVTFQRDGNVHAPKVVFEGIDNVEEGTDYTVSGTKSEKAEGVYTLTVTAKGDHFTGSVDIPWYIMGVGDQTYVYDGNEHALTVEDGADITFPEGNPSYTEAGTYTVPYKAEIDNPWHEADPDEPEKLTVESTATMTIEKRPVNVKAKDQTLKVNDDTPSGSDLVEGVAIAGKEESGLVTGHKVDRVQLVFTKPDRVMTNGVIEPSNAKIVDESGADVGDNYDITYTDGVLTVIKATPIVEAPTALTGLIYSGEDQKLVTPGTTTGGTLEYAVAEGDTAPAEGWAAALPAGKNVGTYNVWYRVAGGDDYEDVAPAGPVQVAIATTDKTKLNEAIAEATEFYEEIKDKYTDIANALKALIDDGKEVADNDNVTAEEVASTADALKTAIDAAKESVKEQELADAKAAAKTALEEKYDNIKNSADFDEKYDEEGKAALQSAYNDAIAAIEGATVADSSDDPKENGAWEAEKAGEEALDAVKTIAEKELDAAKTAAKAELKDKYDNIKNSADFDEKYDEEGKAALQSAYNDAIAAIEKATVADTSDSPQDNGAWKAEKEGEEALHGVKTKAQKIAEVKSEIDNLPSGDELYELSDEEKDAIKKAAKDYNDLTDEEKESITDEKTQKLLNAVKADAKDDLAKYRKTKDDKDYDESGVAELNSAKSNGDGAIDAAIVIDAKDDPKEGGVWKAEKAGEENIAAVKTAVQKVKGMIEDLPVPENVTQDDKDEIDDARNAYDALTDAQKEEITPEEKEKLENAENALVEKMINSLPAPENVTKDNKEDIEKAREAYDRLTDKQKEQINPDLKKKLEDDELALAKEEAKEKLKSVYDELKNSGDYDEDGLEALEIFYEAGIATIDKATVTDTKDEPMENGPWSGERSAENAMETVPTAAEDVTDIINKLPDPESITKDDKEAVNKAREAYEKLTPHQKEQVPEETKKKLEDAEVAVVKDMIDKLPDPSDVTKDNKEDIEKAKEAFDKLTPEQKEQVPEETKKKLADDDLALAKEEAKDLLKEAYDFIKESGSYDKEGLAELEKAYNDAVKAIEETTVTDTIRKPEENGPWKAEEEGEKALFKVLTAAEKVEDIISKLPASENVTKDNKEDIEKAREAYDRLTDKQKEQINPDLKKKLEDAEKAISAAEAEDKYADIDSRTPSDATLKDRAKVNNKLAINTKLITTSAKFKKKNMTIRWKKVKKATNYRVAYRKVGTRKWKMKWTKGKNRIVLKKMKKYGLYQFKIMAVRKSGSTWTKSKWSKVNYRFYANTRQKVKARKGSVTVELKKVKKATGYQILTGKSSKINKMKVKSFKGRNKLTHKVKKLKSGKKVYVRSRPYKKYKGRVYIGVLNKAKRVKVK